MSHRKKNSNGLSRFLKYTGDGMKGKERNLFERELQKDSFEAEAAEGLSMVTADEARKDLGEIERRLMAKKRKHRILTPMRIAATLILLTGTTVLLLVLRNNSKQPLISEIMVPQKTITIPETKGVKKPVSIKSERKISEVGSQKEKQMAAPVSEETNLMIADNHEIVIADNYNENPENLKIHEAAIQNKARSDEKKISVEKRIISGTVISSDDGQPIPGASVIVKGTTRGVITDIEGKFSIDAGTDSSLMLVASFIGMEREEIKSKPDTTILIAMNNNASSLDEVVVVGYGTSKKQDQTGSVVTINNDDNKNTYDHSPPQPITGNKNFREYIESNIRYPADVKEKTKETVVIGMTVLSNGTIANLKVIKSPSQAFSDEAIRLIKEGPSWKPATVNGIPRNEDVKVRIVFKP
jgi:TonB family protein